MKWIEFENAMQRIMKPMKDRLFLVVGRAVISAVNDAQNIQETQLKGLSGEALDRVQRFQHFGFSSNPPAGSEAIIVSLGGNRENSVVIATENRNVRFKNLASGETAIYTDDGTYIVLKKAGQVEVKAATKLTVDVPNSEFTGNVDIKGTLNVVQSATLQATLQVAQDVTAQANVNVTGIVSASGYTGPSGGPMATTVDITSSGNISGGGTDLATIKSVFNSHTHDETGTTTTPPSGSV